MTNLSDLFPTSSSPIKSVQNGYVDSSSLQTSGSAGGRDFKYVDITISPVSASKCIVVFTGSFSRNAVSPAGYFEGSGIASCRLTSSTNLRIHFSDNADGPVDRLNGNWFVTEFN